MKKIQGSLLAVAAVLLLTGCQPTPETEAVTSKNDGAFEAALAAEPVPASEAQSYSYTGTFVNSEGNIKYYVNLKNVPITGGAMPVVRVTPHEITVEEAQTIAAAIFGDAELDEYEPQMSRSELEAAILEKKQLLGDRDALVEMYGGNEELADMIAQEYEQTVKALEKLYADAPETVEQQSCQWTFYPESHYYDPALGEEQDDDLDKTVVIKAAATLDGVPCIYTVTNRSESDYPTHNIFVEVDNRTVTESELYSTEEPTDAEIAADTARAEAILSAIDPEKWSVGAVTVKSRQSGSTGQTYYTVKISAKAVYSDATVVNATTILFNPLESYDYRYAGEQMYFTFSGGRLLAFGYDGLVDTVEVVNESVAILTPDEAMEAFQKYAGTQLIDFGSTVLLPENAVRLDYSVTDMELALVRVRVKNRDAEYYYLPAYIFYGTASAYDAAGSAVYSLSEETGEASVALTVLNAMDGSIIDMLKGY